MINIKDFEKHIEELEKITSILKPFKTATGYGIPLASVYGLGITGFSAAGITSGLSVLGLGYGMIPGILAVVALGKISPELTHKTVKYLIKQKINKSQGEVNYFKEQVKNETNSENIQKIMELIIRAEKVLTYWK